MVGRSGASFGVVNYCASDYWPLNTALYVIDFHENDERFAYYLLKSIDFSRFNSGSAQPSLNRNYIHPIRIRVPPLVEQKRIAHVLSTLDDKIELNRRMNETLEAMARALFKSWFVDFDPVRAKAAGRRPDGMYDATAALFPSSFVDSELGKIPKEWAVATIETIALRLAMGPFGSNIKTDNFVPAGVPVVRGRNMNNGFVDDNFVYLTAQKADELKGSNASPGAIVFTHRGTLGQVGMIPTMARFDRYVVSQSQMLLEVDEKRISRTYVYLHFAVSSGMRDLLANTSTTGVPAIARPLTSLRNLRIVVPPAAISLAFDRIVGALLDRKVQNERQMRTLSVVRDALLPKLLSGVSNGILP